MGYALLTFQPVSIWLYINGWFTELGLNGFLPWQETVGTGLGLAVCGLGTALAQEKFVEWVNRYGPTLEPEERAEVDSRLAGEVAKFNHQLKDFPEAAAAGITDYESFRAAFEQNARDTQLS